ncbi:GPP34 family phosphoprotein [Anaerocolumna xylanovorans]|uniref:Golgi phosphoprotein 3 (GPP34) n=1 Tax=Anaerocolumna xylanovorans DSM 12503 TaxID=1121345 RepID=A0A1M7Y4V6_9FIRM|nr:GPP34 family phosphoprotein [Anaerocolumna xylanovorans]SHO47390.1 Golgi phosphoprotein 3 (GPP34) [Anaerocolumna xylanovorans DSM 12503]
MEKLSYIQQYFICVVNEKGNISKLKGVSVAACLVVGEITELISRGYVIWDEKDRLSVAKPFDDNLTYLKPIYEAIAYFKKSEDVMCIVDMYASNIRLMGNYRKASLNDLLSPIGNSLVTARCVSELPKKGLLRKETKYAPKPEIVTHIIEEIRRAFLENNVITDEMLCLAALLDKSGIIRNYFSRNETTFLEKRMKEARKSAAHASIKKILDYIDDVPKIVSGLDWSGG